MHGQIPENITSLMKCCAKILKFETPQSTDSKESSCISDDEFARFLQHGNLLTQEDQFHPIFIMKEIDMIVILFE
jgi:hypothetical protein